jgi:hypothetical protein
MYAKYTLETRYLEFDNENVNNGDTESSISTRLIKVKPEKNG